MWFDSLSVGRWVVIVALGLAGCSEAAGDASGDESASGGGSTSTGAGGSMVSDGNGGGMAIGTGGAMSPARDAGAANGGAAGHATSDAAAPIFEPGPDDPIPPDPGVTMPFVHSLFTDHMVLQRDAMTPVWGWSTPGDKITVQIASKAFTATADQYGRWLVRIGPFSAGGPWTLTISGPKSVVLQDVFFGDIWLCSGQSNMVLPVGQILNGAAEVAASSNPHLRHFTVGERALKAPRQTLSGNTSWAVAGPSNTSQLSASCYFFGRSLQEKLNVPIGIIVAAVGGTWIEAWTAGPALAQIEDFKAAVSALAAGSDTVSNNTVSVLYNGMIAPLVPYAIKGAAWYQGESNADNNSDHATPDQYSWILPALIADWRKRFNVGAFPFLVVQLPNYLSPMTVPNEEGAYWPMLREAQLDTVLEDPASGLVVTADIGDAMDLHPRNKQDVGARLASTAQDIAYGDSSELSPPTPSSFAVEGAHVRITFDHADSGLIVGSKNGLDPVKEMPTGALTGFAIAGANKNWAWANAVIDGHSVVVSAPQVASPVAVRYGWGTNPPCNLYNKRGLLASPFRTDSVFRLNVIRGSGGGTFTLGATASITAGAAPSGMHFSEWAGDVKYLADPKSASTTVKMPRRYVSVAAIFGN
jgi:sialate O-acetylesterase